MFNPRQSGILIALMVFVLTLSPLMAQTTVPARPDIPIKSFVFAYATGATNHTKISITPLGMSGLALPFTPFNFWLSDSPNGNGLTKSASVTVTNTAVTIVGTTGFQLAITTGSVGVLQFNQYLTGGSGTIQIDVADSNKTTYFPVAMSMTGLRAVGPQLKTSNYAELLIPDWFRPLWDRLKGGVA